MTSAALYARISDDKEGAGLGTARQLADCRELAEKRGWTVAREYEDNDYSAFSGRKRPGYRHMLADVASGTVNAVVAWHTDRLHRSPVEFEEFIALIEQHHVQVEVVNGGMLDLVNPRWPYGRPPTRGRSPVRERAPFRARAPEAQGTGRVGGSGRVGVTDRTATRLTV